MATQTGRTKDGGFVIKEPGQPWMEVDEGTYTAAGQGRVERAVRSGIDSAVDTAGMVMQYGGMGDVGTGFLLDKFGLNPAADLGREMQASNDAAQAGRSNINAGLEIGAGLALDPTNLIGGGALTKGAVGLGRKAFGAAAGGAAPVAGAARGVAIGRGIIDATKSRLGAAAEKIPYIGDQVQGVGVGLERLAESKRVAQGLSAQASDAGRYRAGTMSAREMDDFVEGPQVGLTDTMKAYLDAPDAEASQAFQAMMKETGLRERTDPSVMERLIAGDRQSQAGGYSNLRDSINTTYMREIGADPALFPDADTLGENLTRISAELNDIQKQITVPIDGRRLMEDAEAVQATLKTDRADRALEVVKKDIEALTDKTTGTMTPENAGIIRNRIEDDIRRYSASQSDTEVVTFLSDTRDKLMEQIQARLPAEARQADRELRRQWGLTLSAVTRSGAIGPDGINPKSFILGKGSKDRMTKTGRSRDPLVKFMRTADTIIQALPKSSMTAEGISRRGLPDLTQ